jgi:hypothetical protein
MVVFMFLLLFIMHYPTLIFIYLFIYKYLFIFHQCLIIFHVTKFPISLSKKRVKLSTNCFFFSSFKFVHKIIGEKIVKVDYFLFLFSQVTSQKKTSPNIMLLMYLYVYEYNRPIGTTCYQIINASYNMYKSCMYCR